MKCITNRFHTAKKFEFMYSQKKNCAASVPFHIHVSVTDLYIPTFGPPIFLQQNRQTDQMNIYKECQYVPADVLSDKKVKLSHF